MADITSYLRSVALPVMPEAAHALIHTLNDPGVDVATICAVISKDPGLTATLLRMANSAMFGLSRSVQTLQAAVKVIGMAQLRARALSICMAKAFTMPDGIDRLVFWRYSMLCAGYSRWLASKAGLDEQQAWLAGMMLRLGQLTMASHNATQAEQIEMLPRAPGERWQRERSLTGFDEGMVTAEIARHWDFPEDLVETLASVCDPLAASHFLPIAAVVHLAALLADQTHPNTDTLNQLPGAVLASLGLSVVHLQTSMPSADSLSDTANL